MNKMFERVMHKLWYTCEEATYLIEKKVSAQPLSTIERIRLKGHLAMCKFCRAYEKKVNVIDQAMVNMSKKSKQSLMDSEVKEFKNRLKENF